MEMHTPDAEAVLAALDDLEAAWDKLAALPVRGLDAGQALTILTRLETHRRRQPATEHTLLTHAQSRATAKELGAKSWRSVLSQRLAISSADAGRRLAEATELGPRRTVTGQPLQPELPHTATAQAHGEIGTDHVTIIRDFFHHLPPDTDPDTRTHAETQLATLAGSLTPEGLRAVARQLMAYLDQDGTLDDERQHARKRGVTLGRQELDGMTRITGWLTPELRATLDAAFAKLAAPGYANPDDDTPCLDGTPTQTQISTDTRSPTQRTHDALHTLCRAILAAGTLGQHNGLPVTIVATTTLAELTAGAGIAHTAGGTQIPIPTLIRMAAHAHPYLALLGKPREIRLFYGRTRRTATPGQRLARYALDRGCTKPGCTVPPNRCQLHHAELDWQHGGATDVDQLTLACGCDNRLVNNTPTGWTTRQRPTDNRTEWIPPPHLDPANGRLTPFGRRAQDRINHFHHPEELLRPDDEPGERG